jgi:hypothetical protein
MPYAVLGATHGPDMRFNTQVSGCSNYNPFLLYKLQHAELQSPSNGLSLKSLQSQSPEV